MLKKYISLQTAIMKAHMKDSSKIDRAAYVINEDENYVYVSEKGYNLHRIYKPFWLLDTKKLEYFFKPENNLAKCLGKVPDTYGHFTGIEKEVKVGKKKIVYAQIETDDQEHTQIWVNKELLKYIPVEHCYIKCSGPVKPVFFTNGTLNGIVAMVMPVNPKAL